MRRISSALQLDLAIVDDHSNVVVLGEAKRDTRMLDKLIGSMMSRFGDVAPTEDTKTRGDEARQLAWRLWSVRPRYLWLIGPGERRAFTCSFEPLMLTEIGTLPTAQESGLAGVPTHRLDLPILR